MERIEVKSSNILSIGYDEESKSMEVEFKGGSIYHYDEVTPEMNITIMQAKSHGSILKPTLQGCPYKKIEEIEESSFDKNFPSLGKPYIHFSGQRLHYEGFISECCIDKQRLKETIDKCRDIIDKSHGTGKYNNGSPTYREDMNYIADDALDLLEDELGL